MAKSITPKQSSELKRKYDIIFATNERCRDMIGSVAKATEDFTELTEIEYRALLERADQLLLSNDRAIRMCVSEPEVEIIKSIRCVTNEQLQRLIDFIQKLTREAKG